MGEHIDIRSEKLRHSKPIRENDKLERKQIISFKAYMRSLKETDLDYQDENELDIYLVDK